MGNKFDTFIGDFQNTLGKVLKVEDYYDLKEKFETYYKAGTSESQFPNYAGELLKKLQTDDTFSTASSSIPESPETKEWGESSSTPTTPTKPSSSGKPNLDSLSTSHYWRSPSPTDTETSFATAATTSPSDTATSSDTVTTPTNDKTSSNPLTSGEISPILDMPGSYIHSPTNVSPSESVEPSILKRSDSEETIKPNNLGRLSIAVKTACEGWREMNFTSIPDDTLVYKQDKLRHFYKEYVKFVIRKGFEKDERYFEYLSVGDFINKTPDVTKYFKIDDLNRLIVEEKRLMGEFDDFGNDAVNMSALITKLTSKLVIIKK